MQTEIEAYPPQKPRWLGPLYLREPDPSLVATVVARSSDAAFTYDLMGATRGTLPDGWSNDIAARVVGHGDASWEIAVDALRRWVQFDLDWVSPHDPTVPIEAGRTFAFISQQLAIWSVNVCRVVYVVDDEGPAGRRFGFAYGTVGSHVLRGEERFLLQQSPNGEVTFSIHKFSKPAHPLVRLVGPFARQIQRRFSLEAVERIAQEIG